jgi:Phage integrase family
VPWVAWHTLRHTCGSRLFREGWNVKAVQTFLGHSSPAFTLAVYVHHLEGDMPGLDFFDRGAEAIAATDRSTAGEPAETPIGTIPA